MSYRPSNLLVWFAFGGGAVAFALQFVGGLALSFAQCLQGFGRWQFAVRDWQVGLAVAGFLIGVASTTAAVVVFRRTWKVGDVFGQERRGDGSQPPVGRVHFLALCGLVVNALVLAIMMMDALGTALHGLCVQT